MSMDDGGFLVKFDGKKVKRCYAVAFDYDDGSYTINNQKRKKMPKGIKKITIEIEQQGRSAKR